MDTLMRWLLVVVSSMCLLVNLRAQNTETEIKVYDFDDGLSHRNVFRIAQDSTGFIWVATINGLNRFDGYQFEHYSPYQDQKAALPVEVISDIVARPDGQLWLASPDYLGVFDPQQNQVHAHQIKPGEIVRRESLAPNNLCLDADGKLWCTVYDEKTGVNALAYFADHELQIVNPLSGGHTNRPIIAWNEQLYIAAAGNELWQLDPAGQPLSTLTVGSPTRTNPSPRIVDLQVEGDELWAILNDGRIYHTQNPEDGFQPHPVNDRLPGTTRVGTFLIEEDGDLWLGGLGELWYYDAWRQELTDYDAPIRQLVKNTCTYRTIFQDASEVVWLATDFGAIKVTQSDKLFTQYMSGGSEYCSNVYCSIRGITEDENGLIYIAYYNSIHVLDPRSNAVRPLFPNNDYFNYPFGINYHEGALYTGNGIRIDLATLDRDTLFNRPNIDLGAVITGQDDQLWFGYQHDLFRYNPATETTTPFRDALGQWDSLAGMIAHLFQRPNSEEIWVSTLDQGLYRVHPERGRIAHYTTADDSPIQLPHPQVNAVYEDSVGNIWLGTARGLARMRLEEGSMQIFTTEDGLPNNFINGILPESDTCLWVSTDNGLCRFSLADRDCINFFTSDGLSSNEFNRISFYKSSTGRLYFGGLNGINAFMPDMRYLTRKRERIEAPLMLTAFSYLDPDRDSLVAREYATTQISEPIQLSHRDRMFTASFALADYRHPNQNSFQFFLEGYDANWSQEVTQASVRYTDIRPGDYTLRVRARAGREDWNVQELAIPISIAPAYYQQGWFWILAGLIGAGLVAGLFQYRVYTLQKRRKELEREVQLRTKELKKEKEKSEKLLLNILPADIADELKRNAIVKAKRHEQVTVMFSDFRGFSLISEQLEPEELVAEIDLCFRAFDEITERHGLEKIKTIGDAYLLVGGIGNDSQQQAQKVVEAALEIQEFMAAISVERKLHGRHFFEARIGIHTGPLVAGIVGIRKFAYDIWGNTVNIASRMETNGAVGKVNLSETTYQLLDGQFRCTYHDTFSENNTEVKMYLVEELVR